MQFDIAEIRPILSKHLRNNDKQETPQELLLSSNVLITSTFSIPEKPHCSTRNKTINNWRKQEEDMVRCLTYLCYYYQYYYYYYIPYPCNKYGYYMVDITW